MTWPLLFSSIFSDVSKFSHYVLPHSSLFLLRGGDALYSGTSKKGHYVGPTILSFAQMSSLSRRVPCHKFHSNESYISVHYFSHTLSLPLSFSRRLSVQDSPNAPLFSAGAVPQGHSYGQKYARRRHSSKTAGLTSKFHVQLNLVNMNSRDH